MPLNIDARADSRWMESALVSAREAEREGEVPVGAVVVLDGAAIGIGGNSPRSSSDPTAHAEIVALRQAGLASGNYRLEGAELYVTLEPCLMCVGAMIHARIRRLVFGAPDPKAGASWVLSAEWPQGSRLNHSLEVVAGVRSEECAELLRGFFSRRR